VLCCVVLCLLRVGGVGWLVRWVSWLVCLLLDGLVGWCVCLLVRLGGVSGMDVGITAV